MKRYAKSSREYKRLKSYWRLFLKYGDELESKRLIYQRHLGSYETHLNLVKDSLDLDEGFHQAYETYQWILTAIKEHDVEILERTINRYHKLGNEMDQTISSFKKNKESILNSCCYKDSNGPLEGLNGKIKKIKRTSYGYRNFENFRLRIYLECSHLRVS